MYSIYIKNYLDASGSEVKTEKLLYSIPFHEEEPNVLLQPVVKTEMGKTGTFEFGVYPEHPCYSVWMQMKTIMRVEYDGKHLFRGRVLTVDNSPLTGERKIHLEGDMAFLLDSIQEATEEKDRKEIELAEYLEDLMDVHNTQMRESGEEDKVILLGEVPGKYTSATENSQRVTGKKKKYGNNSMVKTMNALESLLKECGGCFRTRYVNGVCYLDWLDNWFEKDTNQQPIEVGSNVIDLSTASEVENIFTALIPVGSSKGKPLYITDYKTDVHGENNRILVPQIIGEFTDAELNRGYHTKAIYQNAVAQYGVIYRTEKFEDADTPEKLWEYACKWIRDNYAGGIVSFDITAIDMHHIDQAEQQYMTGSRVPVRYPEWDSGTGGVVRREMELTIKSAQYNLHEPDQDTYAVGMWNNVIEHTGKSTSQGGGGGGAKNDENNDENARELDENQSLVERMAWSFVIDEKYNNNEYKAYQAAEPDGAKQGSVLKAAQVNLTSVMASSNPRGQFEFVKMGLSAKKGLTTIGTKLAEGFENFVNFAYPEHDNAWNVVAERVTDMFNYAALRGDAISSLTINSAEEFLELKGMKLTQEEINEIVGDLNQQWAEAETEADKNLIVDELLERVKTFQTVKIGNEEDEETGEVFGAQHFFNSEEETANIEGKTGTASFGRDGDEWLITINAPFTYIDADGNEVPVGPGNINAKDFYIPEVGSFKTRFAYIQNLLADYIYVKEKIVTPAITGAPDPDNPDQLKLSISADLIDFTASNTLRLAIGEDEDLQKAIIDVAKDHLTVDLTDEDLRSLLERTASYVRDTFIDDENRMTLISEMTASYIRDTFTTERYTAIYERTASYIRDTLTADQYTAIYERTASYIRDTLTDDQYKAVYERTASYLRDTIIDNDNKMSLISEKTASYIRDTLTTEDYQGIYERTASYIRDTLTADQYTGIYERTASYLRDEIRDDTNKLSLITEKTASYIRDEFRDDANKLSLITEKTASYIRDEFRDDENKMTSISERTASYLKDTFTAEDKEFTMELTASHYMYTFTDEDREHISDTTASYVKDSFSMSNYNAVYEKTASFIRDEFTAENYHAVYEETASYIHRELTAGDYKAIYDQTASYIKDSFSDQNYESVISRTASYLRNEFADNTNFARSVVEQSASYITNSVMSDDGVQSAIIQVVKDNVNIEVEDRTQIHMSMDDPTTSTQDMIKDNDVWIQSEGIIDWESAFDENVSWAEQPFDWSQLEGAVVKVWKDGEWKPVADNRVLATKADFDVTSTYARMTARNVERLEDTFRANYSEFRVSADIIIGIVKSELDTGEITQSIIEQTSSYIKSTITEGQLESIIEQTASYFRESLTDENLQHIVEETASYLKSSFVSDSARQILEEAASYVRRQFTTADHDSIISQTASYLKSLYYSDDNLKSGVVTQTASLLKTAYTDATDQGNTKSSVVTQTASMLKEEFWSDNKTYSSIVTKTAKNLQSEFTDNTNFARSISEQTASIIRSQVESEAYGTSITQLSNQIKMVVTQKDGKNTIDVAKITAAINDAGEGEALIYARKITLGDGVNAKVAINGKLDTIQLTGTLIESKLASLGLVTITNLGVTTVGAATANIATLNVAETNFTKSPFYAGSNWIGEVLTSRSGNVQIGLSATENEDGTVTLSLTNDGKDATFSHAATVKSEGWSGGRYEITLANNKKLVSPYINPHLILTEKVWAENKKSVTLKQKIVDRSGNNIIVCEDSEISTEDAFNAGAENADYSISHRDSGAASGSNYMIDPGKSMTFTLYIGGKYRTSFRVGARV